MYITLLCFGLEETDESCRQLIVDHFAWVRRATGAACRSPCMFGDLGDCVPRGTYSSDDSFLQKLEKVDAARFFKRQYCYTHNAFCDLFGPSAQADLEVAGLPCWDMSLSGKRLQEKGRTAGVFLCHAKRQVEKQTPLILIENTKAGGIPCLS